MATAFEILDLARVCYEKHLAQLAEEEPEGKGKEQAEDTPTMRHVKERLADTHDALSEISLENERFVSPDHARNASTDDPDTPMPSRTAGHL